MPKPCPCAISASGSDLRQGTRRRDRFRIQLHLDDRRFAACPCPFEGGGEVLRSFHRFAVSAIGFGKGVEIRIDEIGGADTTGIFPLLMHADRAIGAVIDQHGDDWQPVTHGGDEFLPMHHEAAVTGKADYLAPREQVLCGNRRRQAVTHGT